MSGLERGVDIPVRVEVENEDEIRRLQFLFDQATKSVEKTQKAIADLDRAMGADAGVYPNFGPGGASGNAIRPGVSPTLNMPNGAWRMPTQNWPGQLPNLPALEEGQTPWMPKKPDIEGTQKSIEGLSKKVRSLGFAGFISSFQIGRLIGSVQNMANSVIRFIASIADPDKALSEMESTLTDLALAGKLTGDSAAEVTSNYLGLYDAAINTSGAIAVVKSSFTDLQTALLSGMNPALERISNTLSEKFKDPAVVAAFERIGAALGDVAERIAGKLTSTEFIEQLPKMIYLIGGFISGLIDAAMGIVNIISTITGATTEEAMYGIGETLGRVAGYIFAIGIAITTLLSPLQLLFDILTMKPVVSLISTLNAGAGAALGNVAARFGLTGVGGYVATPATIAAAGAFTTAGAMYSSGRTPSYYNGGLFADSDVPYWSQQPQTVNIENNFNNPTFSMDSELFDGWLLRQNQTQAKQALNNGVRSK